MERYLAACEQCEEGLEELRAAGAAEHAAVGWALCTHGCRRTAQLEGHAPSHAPPQPVPTRLRPRAGWRARWRPWRCTWMGWRPPWPWPPTSWATTCACWVGGWVGVDGWVGGWVWGGGQHGDRAGWQPGVPLHPLIPRALVPCLAHRLASPPPPTPTPQLPRSGQGEGDPGRTGGAEAAPHAAVGGAQPPEEAVRALPGCPLSAPLRLHQPPTASLPIHHPIAPVLLTPAPPPHPCHPPAATRRWTLRAPPTTPACRTSTPRSRAASTPCRPSSGTSGRPTPRALPGCVGGRGSGGTALAAFAGAGPDVQGSLAGA